MAMKNTTIWIEPEQLDAIRELSRKTRVPQAVYYREAIDAVLKKYKRHLGSDPASEPEDDAAG